MKRLSSDAKLALEKFAHLAERRGECLMWTGSALASGYGQTSYKGRKDLAHRVAFEIAKGPIPPGMCVCHSCDNPPCIEPSHLWIGTHADNTHDAVNKGRMASGSRHGTHTRPDLIPRGERRAFSKLTREQVVEIKCRIGNESQSDIAADYGVGQGTISKIARGVKWSHV